ncbi:MAG: 50S ribosomal protein L17 [Candidatus Portnoybacteria bacterium]|nr:50S ribosomal protein L17 [Candidatus Portnoybacteria bacterium]
MRHRKKKIKLTKTREQRRALLSMLASSLIMHEKIKTTEGKAKKLKPFIEKTITKSKNDTLSNRRILLKTLPSKTVDKLFKEIGPRYKERPGGYCRIVKLNPRKTDSAKMAIIELVK